MEFPQEIESLCDHAEARSYFLLSFLDDLDDWLMDHATD